MKCSKSNVYYYINDGGGMFAYEKVQQPSSSSSSCGFDAVRPTNEFDTVSLDD